MSSRFYKLYNEILAKATKKDVRQENNFTGSVGIGVQGDYAPGDARVPKNISKKIQRRPMFPKGIMKPKEVK